jgi:hypothetical protein
MFFHSENLCMNVVCLNVHVKFLFRIFIYFEICFLIIGSFAPVTQNEYLADSKVLLELEVLLSLDTPVIVLLKQYALTLISYHHTSV